MVSISVKKKHVGQIQKDLWSITFELTIVDGDKHINYDISEKYREGQSISTIAQKLKSEIQEKIDIYKKEQYIYNNTEIDSIIDDIATSSKL